eukprot:TRINITY_DN4957_c0_g1_i1.p1 TRINITY_DN4957_c0_g1~~TRINITY_DN4957_c0_g1_i1.p1  ORF type:complete len:649 (+),score=114.35 TRINITY_DN4957_c0_g1_i1:49-1995(+)
MISLDQGISIVATAVPLSPLPSRDNPLPSLPGSLGMALESAKPPAFTQSELSSQFSDLQDRVKTLEKLAEDQAALRRIKTLEKLVEDQAALLRTLGAKDAEPVKETACPEANAEDAAVAVDARDVVAKPEAEEGGFFFRRIYHGATDHVFSESIWDAGIVLTAGSIDNAHGFSAWDKITLVFSLILNHIMQAMLLIIVKVHMTESDYTDDYITSMLKWRANVGHSQSNGDPENAMTLLQKVCNQTEWSYQSAAYGDVDSYTADWSYSSDDGLTVPGYFLAVLALLLWISACFQELRTLALQASMLFALPIQHGPGFKKDPENPAGMLLEHISRPRRFMTTLVIILPRAGILAYLCYEGCKMLARTIGLGDLILNSVALLFVMDIDELFFKVILPDKVMEAMTNTRATYHAKSYEVIGGLKVGDCLRYVLWFLCIFLSCNHLLVPFMDEVYATKAALCGGDTSFTWSTDYTKAVTLLEYGTQPNWYQQCSSGIPSAELKGFYKIEVDAGPPPKKQKADTGKLIPKAVLSHAFSTLDASTVSSQAWNKLDDLLQANYESEVGKDLDDMRSCRKFDITQGSSACAASTSNSDYCIWDIWVSECDQMNGGTGGPPGLPHDLSCEEVSGNMTGMASELWCATNSGDKSLCDDD